MAIDRCTNTTPHPAHRTQYGPFGIKDCPGVTEAPGVLDTILSRDENGFTATFSPGPADAAPYDAGDAPTAASRPLPIHRECTALCRDVEHDRDQAHADITRLKTHLVNEQARLRGHLLRVRNERDDIAAELKQTRAELAHVGQVLTDWRNTFTDEPHLLQEADSVLVDLIDGGLLPTAEKPMPAVAAVLGSAPDRAQGQPDSIDLAAQWIAASGIPVYPYEQVRAWLDRLGVPVPVGIHPLLAEIRRAVIAAGDAGYAAGRAQDLRPADWERQAVAAVRDALAETWPNFVPDPETARRMATTAVRAVIDAGLAGHGGRCPQCGSTYPRTMPADADQRCWTCATEEQADTTDPATMEG